MSVDSNTIPQDLLDILVCPVDYGKVHLHDAELTCETCGRAYPVRDGIPVMLVDEARMPDGSRGAPADDTGRTPGAAESAE